jgi:hypothetical protein
VKNKIKIKSEGNKKCSIWELNWNKKKLIKGKTYQKNEGHIRKKKQHKLLLNDEIENQ